MGRKQLDLVGKTYGRLTVLEYAYRNSRGKSMWKCRCKCGKTSIVLGAHLTSGHTKSCGCYSTDATKGRFTTHGMTKTRLYNIWRVMLKRCDYGKATNYKNYGAKGIQVCLEWYDFKKFKEWSIGHGYADDLTIDRIDNNKGYAPENCRWVDMKAQGRNNCRNKCLTFRGETHCLMEWSEIMGINYRTLQNRINLYGWSIERAFTTPVHQKGAI